jgi:hypothetical protein
METLVGAITQLAVTRQCLGQQEHTDRPRNVINMTPASRAAALFASSLQPSDHPSVEQVTAAIRASLQQHGGEGGCAALRAAEYGDHPESAAARMRWARELVDRRGSLAATAARAA